MNRILAIAINTFREAVRDRVLYGVLGLASAVLIFSLALAELSLDQEARIISDIGMASISFFAVIIAVFLGASLLYKEIERKTLYVILPKPVHRSEFLLGKFVGIALTACVFIGIMGAIQLIVMGLQAGARAAALGGTLLGAFAALGLGLRFARDRTAVLIPWSALSLAASSLYASSAGVPLEAVWMALVLSVGEIAILTAVALLFGSFSTPFLSGALTLGIWLAGRSADAMVSMRSQLLGPEIKALLRALAEVVPNFNLFVPPNATFSTGAGWHYVASSMAYASTYSVLLLIFASLVFRRRDFL